MGIGRAVIGDALITFMWVFCVSTLGLLTSILAAALQVQGSSALLITVSLLSILLFIFSLLGEFMGGATFNPTATASLYAIGAGGDSLFSVALRLPAQAAGAVGGAVAIMEVMPLQYKHMLAGPSLKVDLHSGAVAEGVLTFAMTFIVLFVILRGPSNSVFRAVILAVFTISLILAGSSYTGPSMNPANAFGWAYVYNRHKTWEQFYVYWICPFIGSILAAWIFRMIFPSPPSAKPKTA